MTTSILIFWNVMSCSQKFTQVSENYHACLSYSSALNMNEIRSTSVNFYQTIWLHTPEDSTLHSHHRENFKFHMTTKLYQRIPTVDFYST
jgi:hypothetical protein